MGLIKNIQMYSMGKNYQLFTVPQKQPPERVSYKKNCFQVLNKLE